MRTINLLALLFALIAFTALGCEKKSEAPAAEEAAAEEITWRSDHDAALADAKKAGKPVVIDFTAEWCAPCQRLEKETFSDAKVIAALQSFVTVRVDGTDTIEAIEKEMETHGVASFPTVVFVSSSGETLASPRLDDFVGPEEFLKLAGQVK